VWGHSKNEELRKARSSAFILRSGDVLHIPEPAPRRWLSVKVGAPNRFVVTLPKVKITVTFLSLGKPLASEPYTIQELPDLKGLTTDGSGTLTFDAPVSLEIATLEFTAHGLIQELRIGHLDPITSTSGVVQRLRNLGFLADTERLIDELDDPLASQEIANFQAAHGCPVTGTLDDASRKKLSDVHGC
jgi:hypothetical protein